MKALETEARELRVHEYEVAGSRVGMLPWTDFLSSLRRCVVR